MCGKLTVPCAADSQKDHLCRGKEFLRQNLATYKQAKSQDSRGHIQEEKELCPI